MAFGWLPIRHGLKVRHPQGGPGGCVSAIASKAAVNMEMRITALLAHRPALQALKLSAACASIRRRPGASLAYFLRTPRLVASLMHISL
jgi:hypothetical protein